MLPPLPPRIIYYLPITSLKRSNARKPCCGHCFRGPKRSYQCFICLGVTSIVTIFCKRSVFEKCLLTCIRPRPTMAPQLTLAYSCLFVSYLRPMGLDELGYQSHLLQRCDPVCGHEGSSYLNPALALSILSRCKFSILTIRQPMAGFYFLTFSSFPLRKPEYNFGFQKNPTISLLV